MLVIVLFRVLLNLIPACIAMQPAATSTVLTVDVYNLRNDKGTVRLSLFRSADGFPSEPEKAFRKVIGKAKDQSCTIVLENLPPGEYAISLLHDENNNGRMDTNLVGIPKEGYGASNDAKVTFGPPKYSDARFVLGSEPLRLRIKMRYM